MSDVRDLLGRAAEDAGRPMISTEAVYAKAARVRWRRRTAASVAALAVVGAGAFSLPGLISGETGEASVAAPTELVGGNGQGKRLARLLPPDAGAVEQVSWAVLLKGAGAEQAEVKHLGPLDGEYAIRKDGGVGYLALHTRSAKDIAAKTGGKGMAGDLCEKTGSEDDREDCVREKLPDGRVLTIWHQPAASPGDGEPRWGRELTGRLTLNDGSALFVRDSAGIHGKHAQGPALTSPPLTREQLRALMLRPELLPKN
ncbi:hypothetical protein AMK26_17340 [Streptomyces sp. CB03234]|uniref:hypothetical protein n=1 Tax=Streptomyces sp. (strain CB03234) TaxID=1703937 RepID=UPI000940279B|nr:hypothetical protein [Streptomyces sp. CB03234]OKK03301.1 hypothetical protein AMK26_17340 [Streptomyces sp. CB03234]